MMGYHLGYAVEQYGWMVLHSSEIDPLLAEHFLHVPIEI
jgi:hypothetical protein